MTLSIGALKKISGILKVACAIVSLGIILKYDNIKNEDFTKLSKAYDWGSK